MSVSPQTRLGVVIHMKRSESGSLVSVHDTAHSAAVIVSNRRETEVINEFVILSVCCNLMMSLVFIQTNVRCCCLL